jgi:hypothetical protein
MSATISASGTWTALDFDPIGQPKTNWPTQPGLESPANGMHQKDGMSVRWATAMNFEALKGGDLPELMQFVQLLANGYSINTQAAIALLYQLVSMMMNRSNPDVGTASSRLYAP